MKELRIIFATACLIYLAGFTFTASASEHENEEDDDKYEVRLWTGYINSEHRSDTAKERIKKQREKEKERLEKLREKQKKLREKLKEAQKKRKNTRPETGTGTTQPPVSNTGSTSTGTTNTGTTNTGTTAPVTKSRTVSYGTPDGSVNIGFSVTITNGIITAASSTTMVGGTSGAYQNIFAAGLSQAVVGKKAAGLNIAAIGGASLTTTAFENFVAQ